MSNQKLQGHHILLIGIFFLILAFIIGGGCDGFQHRGMSGLSDDEEMRIETQQDMDLIEQYDRRHNPVYGCTLTKRSFDCPFDDDR